MAKTQRNLDGLREVLFDTLDRLRDKEDPMDVERAEAINATAQVLINTAKVEVDHALVTGGRSGSSFLGIEAKEPEKPGQTVEKVPGGRVIRHSLMG